MRHDRVVSIAAEGLRHEGWDVVCERSFHTNQGLRKPDIIAARENRVVVVDAQIVGDGYSLDRSHARKVSKYATNEDLLQTVATEYSVEVGNVSVTSVTVSYRGIWSPQSAEDIIDLGVGHRYPCTISCCALRGSHMNWTRFNQMTDLVPFNLIKFLGSI